MDCQATLIYCGRIIAEDVSELICCDGLATATLPETPRVVPVKKVEVGPDGQHSLDSNAGGNLWD